MEVIVLEHHLSAMASVATHLRKSIGRRSALLAVAYVDVSNFECIFKLGAAERDGKHHFKRPQLVCSPSEGSLGEFDGRAAVRKGLSRSSSDAPREKK
jgi:hypothetical protein